MSKPLKLFLVTALGIVSIAAILGFTPEVSANTTLKKDKYTPGYFQLKDTILQVIEVHAHDVQMYDDLIMAFDRGKGYAHTDKCYALRQGLYRQKEDLKQTLAIFHNTSLTTWSADSTTILKRLTHHKKQLTDAKNSMADMSITND
ncbi:hypothetical protein FNH22_05475 [Fulvivirga sp. M361]|uniref:hypothetical protein n=1 Tax=Fulvivirga sp. M361 TaxID=2594266 RepID=UPI00117A3B39|nr:hypothetical protein [Fulvivirga sp. M361]TRX60502.1 hypothetical protein FNH22_05475 [Fulvivirga sp. M361]